MILENKDEENAFNYMLELCNIATNRGCNDLEKSEYKKFNHLLVDVATQNNEIIKENIKYDFQIPYWLKQQIKGKKSKYKISPINIKFKSGDTISINDRYYMFESVIGDSYQGEDLQLKLMQFNNNKNIFIKIEDITTKNIKFIEYDDRLIEFREEK